MNLLLLEPEELDAAGQATLSGRRLLHAREVLKAQTGDTLRVGVLGGEVGTARVVELTPARVSLAVRLGAPPPPRPGIDLLLALPRPKALKRFLPAAASLGVDRIVLVNAYRVEKSYFDSKVLEPGLMRDLLVLGLEQAQDTRLPEVLVRERFRPFVEDELDRTFGTAKPRFVADPSAPAGPGGGAAVLAVGPEGGWIPFELELLARHGFRPVGLGPRTLRVETVVPYLLGAWSARPPD